MYFYQNCMKTEIKKEKLTYLKALQLMSIMNIKLKKFLFEKMQKVNCNIK